MNNEIRVFSPSYRRGASLVPTAIAFPFVRMVVHESEADQYKKSGHNVSVCPDKLKGNIARVRNWILDQNKDCRGIVMLDDDVKNIFRWQNQKEWKLSADEVEEMIEQGFALAEEWNLFMWGINMVYDKGAYREAMPFSTLRPVLGTFCAIRPNPLRYDERFSLKEDYDYAIQHLHRYHGIMRINFYTYAALHNEQVGGCAMYRTVDKERAQFQLLQEKWGSDIVRKDYGNDKSKVRGANVKKTFDLNPKIVVPIDGV